MDSRVIERHHRTTDYPPYVLRLYVTGMSPGSTAAVAVVRSICDDLLEDRHDLEVIDLYRTPQRAARDRVVAAPTLVRQQPLPMRRLVGDLADRRRVVQGLELEEER